MPDMDRISSRSPFWNKNVLLSSCCSSFRGFSGPQRRIQSIFQSFFWGEGGCQGILAAVLGQQGDPEPPLAFPSSAHTL